MLGYVVLKLYQASLDLKYMPQRWRTAKIIVLRKPNKPDYSKPKAYRPISLLGTISKGLEAVVVRRLSYLAETYRAAARKPLRWAATEVSRAGVQPTGREDTRDVAGL